MFWLIQLVLFVLLSFSESLETKLVFLNNEPSMNRPTVVDLNPSELNYLFMITLDKCNGSCNVVDDLSTKICYLSKTKVVNVKVFEMIVRIYEANTMLQHISCKCKSKFGSATCNSNQKQNHDECQCECKQYRTCKKIL